MMREVSAAFRMVGGGLAWGMVVFLLAGCAHGVYLGPPYPDYGQLTRDLQRGWTALYSWINPPPAISATPQEPGEWSP